MVECLGVGYFKEKRCAAAARVYEPTTVGLCIQGIVVINKNLDL